MFNRTFAVTLLLAGASFTGAYGQEVKEVETEIAQNNVLEYLAQHAKPRMVKATYMGLTAERVSPAMSSQLKLPQGLGLVVTHVVPDGPAADAGIQKHDVLHKLDDQLLVNFEQFAVLVRVHKPGDTVRLSVIRGGEPVSADVTLSEHEVRELPVGPMNAPTGIWFGGERAGPFGDMTVFPPQIDTEKIQAEILRAIPKEHLKFGDEHVIHAKDRYMLRIIDGEHKILIDKLSDEAPDITVEDAEGHLLHKGTWEPGSDATSGLPTEVIEKIESVLTAPAIGEPIRIRAEEIEITPAPALPGDEGGEG